MRNLVRARQRTITQVLPHNANSRVLIGPRPQPGGLTPITQPGFAYAITVGNSVLNYGYLNAVFGKAAAATAAALVQFATNTGEVYLRAPGGVQSWGAVGAILTVDASGLAPITLAWDAPNTRYLLTGQFGYSNFIRAMLGRVVAFNVAVAP